VSSRLVLVLAALTALAVGCSSGSTLARKLSMAPAPPTALSTIAASGKPAVAPPEGLTVPQRRNVYASASAGIFAAGVAQDRPLVYVPHNRSGDVWVIDPATYQVLAK
jgi:hypothetical protein